MTGFQPSRRISLALVFASFALGLMLHSLVLAQSSKPKQKPKPASSNEVKQIDMRLGKLQETFESESTAIIDSYEKVGQYERAKMLLEVILKLDPDNEAVKKRIASMGDRMLERSDYERRLEISSDWTFVGTVNKDRPARVEASGDFRVNIPITNLGPDGFPTEDIRRDLQANVPTGALMGMIATETSAKDKKSVEPFAIKSKHDFTPTKDGELYLKVNLPPGTKSTGDLKLKLFGVERPS